MVQARKIIAEGCEKCPNSEDVWFHAAELNVSTLPFAIIADDPDTRKRKGHSRQGRSASSHLGQDLAQGVLARK
jgi:hypothetical protein